MLHRLIHTVAVGLFTLFCASSVLAAEQGTTVIYYHHDVRGDPIVVTTETGQIQWIESYRGYGQAEPRVSSEGIGLGDNAAENHDNRLSFTGHESDGGSGLTYMKARYYDPLVGRFYSNDPVGFKASNTMMFNRYTYGNGNPYKYTDPDGREVFWIGSEKSIAAAKIELLDTVVRSPTGLKSYIQLKKSKRFHTIDTRPTDSGDNETSPDDKLAGYADDNGNNGPGTGTTIFFDPLNFHGATDDSGSTIRKPGIALGHEVGHAADFDSGSHPQHIGFQKNASGDVAIPQTPNHETGRSMTIDNEIRETYENYDTRSFYIQ